MGKKNTVAINDGAKASDIDIRAAKLNAETDPIYDDAYKKLENAYEDQIDDIGERNADGSFTEGTWAGDQAAAVNRDTEFTINKIEQQKDKADKDYLKEQKGAYADYQKMIDPYGVEAEKVAAMGMANTGYAESLKVSMYNTYQNRVMVAREAHLQIMTDYDNAMTEARNQNSSLLAEIAFEAAEKRNALLINWITEGANILDKKATARRANRSQATTEWKALMDQMNTEAARAEQKRQFNEEMAFKQAQFNYQKQQDSASSGGRVYSPKAKGGSSDDSSSEGVQTTKEASSNNSKNGMIFGPVILGNTLKNFGLSGGLRLYSKNGKIGIKKS